MSKPKHNYYKNDHETDHKMMLWQSLSLKCYAKGVECVYSLKLLAIIGLIILIYFFILFVLTSYINKTQQSKLEVIVDKVNASKIYDNLHSED